MTAPTLHERRPDAEVYVYGDDAPISDAEWHCARLMWALHALPLVVEPYVQRRVAVGNAEAGLSAVRPTRAEAVAALAEELTVAVADKASAYGAAAHQACFEARRATERAEAYEREAVRLRAAIEGGVL